MFKVDKRPTKDSVMIVNDNERFTEITSPKSQIKRTPRMTKKRVVTFTESTSTEKLSAENTEVGEREENDAIDHGIEPGSKTEMITYELNREVSKLKNLVDNGLRRLKQQRLKHEQIVGFLVEKGKNNEAEIENQNIKLKIARESEMENKAKYLNMKIKVSKLSNKSIEDMKVVASLTESKTNYERELRVLEAKVSGLEARGQVGGSPRINESQLREQVNLQEILQQTSQNELEICKNRIKVFEDEKDGDQRLIKGLERGAATMKKELQRLNKADVQYQSLLDIHHGGSLRKYQNFMKTAELSADCPDVVVERWRKLNSYSYDEGTMVLLTKLIISERVLKSKALLMDYIKSTLDFEPNDDEYHGHLRAPVKKEKESSNLLLMTPEKAPRRRKGSQNPLAYQDAYKRHLLYADVTNKTDIYAVGGRAW